MNFSHFLSKWYNNGESFDDSASYCMLSCKRVTPATHTKDL